MNIENTASQMRKGVLEFCVLSVIRQGEAYPSDIIEKMKAANFQLFEGTLYPLLTRLKNAGMVSYRWVESNSGPPRKYFSLTPAGLDFYQELQNTWKEMADAVHAVTTNEELSAAISQQSAVVSPAPAPAIFDDEDGIPHQAFTSENTPPTTGDPEQEQTT